MKFRNSSLAAKALVLAAASVSALAIADTACHPSESTCRSAASNAAAGTSSVYTQT